jgi:hypothetical protein
MPAKVEECEKLSMQVQTGLASHDLSTAIAEVYNLRQTQTSAGFHATLSDANAALHKAGKLPGLEITGVDNDALLVRDAHNHYFGLNQSGVVGSLGEQQQFSLPAQDSPPPRELSYDPSTNTGYYNVTVGANQTLVGLDTTLSRADNTGVAAEAQRQVGKFNVMYEHDLGDKGQDVWLSAGVGNDGNNTLAATFGNQSKPGVVYMASFDKDNMRTLSIQAESDRTVKVTFRARI